MREKTTTKITYLHFVFFKFYELMTVGIASALDLGSILNNSLETLYT